VESCGKLLVATNDTELARLDALLQRAGENRIACERIDGAELRRREPAITGLGAIFVPATGIVDYRQICLALVREITEAGGTLVTSAKVFAIEESGDRVTIHTGCGNFISRAMVACAGLQADRIAAMAGFSRDFRIVPFRGEYFRLPEARKNLVRTLIYPVPDPDLPFLGIHLTRMIDGGLTVGPNAVLGFAREKYAKFSMAGEDVRDMLGFPGFWRVLAANLRPGFAEIRNSLSRRAYLQACRKYCPELTLADLIPQEAGIRAQAVLRDGSLVHDFMLKRTARSVHVCNAPSPAATSALPIGRMIAGEVHKLR
jgi:L-2-hydroxyglutarate oxidase